MIHLLVDGGALGADTVEVTGDDYRHLFRARRLGVGDRVRLVDGRGGAKWSVVGAVAADRARLEVQGSAPTFEPARAVALFVSVVRPERAAWLVEKATELGVRELQWIVSERAARSLPERALARQARIAKSALEQCGGSWLPRIGAPIALGQAAVGPGAAVLHPGAGPPLAAVRGVRSLVIGPEGGFSAEEIERFERSGAALAHLGPCILRAETAAIAALATVVCAH